MAVQLRQIELWQGEAGFTKHEQKVASAEQKATPRGGDYSSNLSMEVHTQRELVGHGGRVFDCGLHGREPVSYTHLTLPTKRIV